MSRYVSRSAKRRTGSVALEFLFILPLLLGLILAAAEYALIVGAEQKLCRASHAGARAASCGAGPREICAAVEHCIGHGRMRECHAVTVYRVAQTHEGERLVPVAHPERLPPRTPLVVCVEAPAREVTPNLLRHFGLDLCGDRLCGETTICKE